MSDLSYIIFRSDVKYLLIGIVIALALFIGWNQYGTMTGFIVQVAGRADIIIDDGNVSNWYSISFPPGRTALDALKDVAYVDYKIYEQGIELTGIGGLTNSEAGRWTWTVNGEQTNDTIDAYLLSDGDSLVFRYAPASAENQ
jgi:hypothetical protein